MGNERTDEKEMTLIEHLDELRTRLIIMLVAIAVCSIAGWFIGPYALDSLIGHLRLDSVQVLGVPDSFKIRLKLAFWLGFVIATPVILTEIWLFIAPGLYSQEKKFVFPAVFSSYTLFLGGASFAFYILPFTIRFLEKFLSDRMRPNYSLDLLISFTGSFILAFAVVFQIPIVLVLLAKLGIVSYETLAKNRKYAVLIGLIIGAVLTPADPLSMVMLAFPLYLLFEISLVFIRFMKFTEREESEDS